MTKNAFAMLSLELTRGVSSAVPIAIVPFNVQGGEPDQNVSAIIMNDLKNSGRFKVSSGTNGTDNVVMGKVQAMGLGQYQVSFQLFDVFNKDKSNQAASFSQKFTVSSKQLRPLAHHISDLIYQHILGVKGVFSTRLAYIVVQRQMKPTHYILEVCDVDGYNPQSLLDSTDPIMSPAWSPNGKHIAYVSFENKHAAIFLQNVETGGRSLISEFPGINGAPAWSPDGRKLALVLSKSGSPNIYTMNVATHQLTQLTHDFYINTEPAWSREGGSLIFTSNRSGNPQIYQLNLASGKITRLTYEGNYNARASFTPDGNHIVMLNRESNLFNIGIMDLDTGGFKVLTRSGSDSESPSIAPNGGMVLYGSLNRGRSVLAMAATDGSIQLYLPARNGEVQDPAWSPFLT
jgi:TolB protein